jgi:hypothetical protein
MIAEILSVYIVTLIIAKSSILSRFRTWLKVRTPKLKFEDYSHFIECRLCVGFWVSVIFCILNPQDILPVYGASYFLATLERT